MLGKITSTISQYTGIGQQKKVEEAKTPDIKSNTTSDIKPASPPEVKGESFSSDNSGQKPLKDPSGSREFLGTQSMLSSSITGPPLAEREGPIAPNQKINITGPAGARDRAALIREANQNNPVSRQNGNQKDICSGAALANAIIMDSKTPDAAKKNGESIEKTYGQMLEKNKDMKPLSNEEQEALKNLKSGNMSPKDVQHLQQVMYRMNQKAPGHDPKDKGATALDLGNTVTMLKSNGGFAGGSHVTFHNNLSGKQGLHWTTTVDGVHADSSPEKGKMASVIGTPSGGPPELQKGQHSYDSSIDFSGYSDGITIENNSQSYNIKGTGDIDNIHKKQQEELEKLRRGD